MKSLYGKLIAGFFISIAISFSIAGYFGLQKHGDSLEEMTNAHLEETAMTVVSLMESHDYDILEDLANATGMSIGLYFENGETFQTKNDEHPLPFKHYVPFVANQQNYYEHRGQTSIYLKKIMSEPENYILFLKKNTMEEQSVFEKSIMVALSCIFITGSIIFLIVADVIVKPIKRLTKATDELSNGNYDTRVHYYGKDEIAVLSESFNSMADRLLMDEENRQQFISDISHEFQTPLTSIQGFAKILKQENLTEQQRIKYTDIILFQSQRLSALAKNMLQLTVLDSEDPKLDLQDYYLLEQLNRVISMQKAIADEKEVDVVVEYPKKDILIHADENRMEQVWINLINNAIKYTMSGGVVTIKVKKSLKEVEIRIEDTGIGMSKEAISHVFDRFYREDKSRSIVGNGLGLAIVKKIVELHDAKITVESIQDVGSVFTVTIPLEFDLKKTLSIKNHES